MLDLSNFTNGMGVGVLLFKKKRDKFFTQKRRGYYESKLWLLLIFLFVNPRNISVQYKFLEMGFDYIRLRFQKHSICVPLRISLLFFRNRHQSNVTFRHQYSITLWGGGWKGNQILKYRFSLTVMRKVLLKFSSFVSIRYLICF